MPTITAADLDHRYDLIVIHGSPAGIAAALRAGRAGLRVLLVNHHAHLGGLPASGLAVWDTHLETRRSPIHDELRHRLVRHYRQRYGSASRQYHDCRPQRPDGAVGPHSNGTFEPHVFEAVVGELVAAEPTIDVLLGHVPVAVERAATGAIAAIALAPRAGGAAQRVATGQVVDASYEGDLLVLAQAPHRLGREGMEAHGEPHAGRRCMGWSDDAPDAAARRHADLLATIDMRHFGRHVATRELPGTGDGDDLVQACNFRVTVTRDDARRVPLPTPSKAALERAAGLEFGAPTPRIPNAKADLNRPQLSGAQVRDYLLADWPRRDAILAEFRETALAALWQAQQEGRPGCADWGLCRDEFVDNGHFPHELYLREGRRLEGAAVLTEHDCRLAEDYDRAPVHADAVAVTDWYIDVHACSRQRVDGSFEEGKVMLHRETVPAQVPYRCLYAPAVPNLLVPICLSASHLAHSAVRLEPTWMQLGEVCGLAAVCAHEEGCHAAGVDVDALQWRLAREHHLLAFVNDLDVGSWQPWIPAQQWAACRGCFPAYDARLDEPVSEAVAAVWVVIVEDLRVGRSDPSRRAAEVAAAEAAGGPAVDAADLARRLGVAGADPGPIARGPACLLLREAVASPQPAAAR